MKPAARNVSFKLEIVCGFQYFKVWIWNSFGTHCFEEQYGSSFPALQVHQMLAIKTDHVVPMWATDLCKLKNDES